MKAAAVVGGVLLIGCVAHAGAVAYAVRAPYVIESDGVHVTEGLGPAASEASARCAKIPPVCHINERPWCIVTGPSIGEAHWACVRDATPGPR